jgi:cell division protein ZapE
MSTTPQARYQELVASHQIERNPQQGSVVELLEQTYQQLLSRSGSKNWFSKPEPVKGIYLWGEVGVGKSFLLDLLYQSLPVPKLRQHYHVFMQDVQQQLFAVQGTKNPLRKIAKDYAKKYRIFFLDEFIVNDICNAMVLAGLLEAIFEQGICLITTSNIIPDKLYEYGFQRDQFLPAIEQIKTNMSVMQLDSVIDYRRSEDHTHERYLTPLTQSTDDAMQQLFTETSEGAQSTEPWEICGRRIPIVNAGNDCAWFDFHVLCAPPRSQLDYIAISKKIKHLFLAGVPILSDNTSSRDQASLFIKLIDVMYDEGIKLTMSAAAPVDELYPAGDLTGAFERTRSRIVEMCS